MASQERGRAEWGGAMTVAQVAAEADLVQPVAATPGWTENLLFQVHDGAAGVAVWAHWGRIPEAPAIWEGVVAVYLPGRRLLVSRSFGRASRIDEASSGPLSFRCVEPGKRWQVHFDGMARPATAEQTAAGPLTDGETERLELDLAFTGIHPLWSATGDLGGQTWAHAHLEQAGQVSGSIVHSGHRIPVQAFGFRDHSHGPRDSAALTGDTWCSGVFPSGRAFLAFEVWQATGASLAKGFVWDGSRPVDAQPIALPRLTDPHGAPRAFTLELATPVRPERIHVDQRACMTWTLDRPVGMTAGARLDARDDILLTEGPARLLWDGERADGWIEKSSRPSLFTPTQTHQEVQP